MKIKCLAAIFLLFIALSGSAQSTAEKMPMGSADLDTVMVEGGDDAQSASESSMITVTEALSASESSMITVTEALSMQEAPEEAPKRRKKVGVVLSGGGAKGVAHIGALKVIEEAGIPIDYITGTSMGAIVGGLYAIGYDTHTMDSLVRVLNWREILSDNVSRRNMSFTSKESKEKYILTVPLRFGKGFILPSALVDGNNIYNLITELTVGYHDSLDFNTLPIPFACMAYDMVTGKAVALDKGSLPLAIRASMSIPGAFAPVRIDSMLLIDGGISNNFPADVLKQMGADIIIGIDVGSKKRDIEELQSIPDMINQITYFIGEESFDHNKKLVDLYVRPNVKPYTAASFTADAVDTLVRRGEVAMREKWEELMVLREKIGIDYYAEPREKMETRGRRLKIGDIRIEGVVVQKESRLLNLTGLKENSEISYGDIHDALSKLQGMDGLSSARAQLEKTEDGHDLIITIKEDLHNSASIGLRFDSEEKAAILLHLNLATEKMINSHFEITGRLSESPYAKAEYIVGNELQRKFKFSYTYRYNDLSMYSKGRKTTSLDYDIHTLDVSYANIKIRNFKAGIGLRYDYYGFNSILLTPGYRSDYDAASEGIVSYYASLNYESLDRLYYPRKGISFTAGYTFYTTNFVSYKGKRPFSAIDFDLYTALSVSKRVCFLPGVFGRVLIGKNLGYPAINVMGGAFRGRYMSQQMPFVGIQYLEKFDNAVIGVKLDLRLRLWVKTQVSLKMNYAKQDDDFIGLFKGDDLYGVGIEYAYNSIVGPLSIMVDYSNIDKKVGVYFNLGYYF